MLRRSLPVVAATAAAFVLVPGSASAMPDQAPVDNYYAAHYRATADIPLSHDRLVTAELVRIQAPNRTDWRASLHLQITTPCTAAASSCVPSTTSADLDLTDDQVSFDRRLRRASVTGVTVTFSSPTSGGGIGYGPPMDAVLLPGGGTPVGGQVSALPSAPNGDVVVSLTFVGTGALTHDVAHVYGPCGDGSTDCPTLWVDDARDASAVLTLDDESSKPAAARLTYEKSVQVAAPKPVYGGY
jgi:hypothetical protein